MARGAILYVLLLGASTLAGCKAQDWVSGALGGRSSNEKSLNRRGGDIGAASPPDGDSSWNASTGHRWSP